MARRKATQYKRVRVETDDSATAGGVLGYLAVLIILPVFLLGLVYVKLNSDQVKMKRELTRMRHEFGLKSKELANLRVEVEMYRDGDHIGKHVITMGLDLDEPEYGRVIRMPAGIPVRPRPAPVDAMVADR